MLVAALEIVMDIDFLGELLEVDVGDFLAESKGG